MNNDNKEKDIGKGKKVKILLIDEMPLSVNGKIDFKAVQNWVSQRS